MRRPGAFGMMSDMRRLMLFMFWVIPILAMAETDVVDELARDDSPVATPVEHPAWFKLSFLELQSDLAEASEAGKKGLIVYFGQRDCPYCRALMEVNFGKRDIELYTRKNFDVVAIDIHGQRLVTDLQGVQWNENAFAIKEQTQFTPSLIFIAADGSEALRLRGYYPPYKFRAALEYVADGHFRTETFRDYLERADPPPAFEEGGMHDEPFFDAPPYALQRRPIAAQRPLMVFFEQGSCHACDVLHGVPLQDPEVRATLEGFDVVQLNLYGQQPVVTPTGQRLTAEEWARELGLFYTPTLVFFDRKGSEILRVDSVVGFYRLKGVLAYVASDAYRRGLTFQQWRRQQGGGS